MNTKELTFFAVAVGWLVTFNVMSRFIPFFMLFNTLTLSHIIIGLFIEYLPKRQRVQLITFNILENLGRIISLANFREGLMTITQNIVSSEDFPPELETAIFLTMISVMFIYSPFYYNWLFRQRGLFKKIAKRVSQIQ